MRKKQIFNKLDFSKIEETNNLKIDIIKKEIIDKILLKNGNIDPSISNYDIIVKRNLLNLIKNIKYLSNFLPNDEKIKNRIKCILNDIKSYQICRCGEEITKFNKSSLTSNIFNLYCSQKCSNRYTNYEKGSEFYKKVSINIVKTRRENNSYIPTDSFRYYLRNKENYENFKKVCKNKYGVENPGVLGAYSSKSAEKYIRSYINENNIDENRCYFKGGGINNKEYFKCIIIDGKKIYMSYDLVVVDDNNKIILVLEYNGPWHYKIDDINMDANGPATPYKKSKSKLETYNFDLLKLNTIFVECKNILIYWEKIRKLENYDGEKL